jgi:general secretion pathway protein D
VKTTALILLVFLTSLNLRAQTPSNLRSVPLRSNMPVTNTVAGAATNIPAALPAFPLPSAQPKSPAVPAAAATPAGSSAAPGTLSDQMVPAGDVNFQGVDVDQVLDVYARYVGRTLLRAGLPSAKIVLRTETPLTRGEVIQALQAVLALNGISLINIGDKFVKAVPVEQANSAGAAIDRSTAGQLPDVGQYVTHIVQLKYVKPTIMVPVIQPFAKLPNSILAIDDNGILVLRDNAENVKRMLEMIQEVDVSVPAEYISEVIPIKYALADDIANALNSLGGSGGSTVSIGSSGASSPISGMGTRSGSTTGTMGTGTSYQSGGISQPNQSRTLGTTANGTPSSGSSFSQRLNAIINRASSGQQEAIQVFGQTKIIADTRSNSLLVFATQSDMERIKAVVAKLDVLLSQVLIEAVIMDVSLNSGWSFGISAAQDPKNFSPSMPAVGGGGINNGQPLANFLGSNNFFKPFVTSTNSFANLSSGLSYFGNIGPNWDVALQAAESDSTTTIIQRPRIQTSQAKAAQFFVGQTVPYITSTYNGGAGIGNSSSYSQLSVGVELDVTPFINPDGLVVMDINQEIDDLNGFTTIENVGNVPNTTKRTLSSEIAVKDRDTIMLGGFIRSGKDKNKSGVPILMDIPLLGNLFTSRSDSKTRSETVVMIRPTVLRTPEIAAAQAVKEQQRLPGISAAVAEETRSEHKLMEAEKKAEQKREQEDAKSEQSKGKSSLAKFMHGFAIKTPAKPEQGEDKSSQPVSPNGSVDTNAVALPNQ